ncbi:membrane protein implicated in regulation of membrane protease activity [Actinophytocola oryzae]|uniref:Membrane protein implicated in regulation of membrane protease activity n=2 Tax=Actinophytocola oryzae TaxID=502181 RepID=A0A4R7V4Q7_9PSEU|nr:membrane protein implicated in regulation of membrane protease activity [Actinophytocola oryzae]
MAALLWLLGGFALMAAEILSGDFFLLMIGVGALAGAGAEGVFGNTVVSVVVFAVVSIGLVTFARPWLKRRMHGELVATNVDALVGRRAVVVSAVDGHGGQVRLGGDVWSARTFDSGRPIAAGREVTVVEIAGATAVVLADAE